MNEYQQTLFDQLMELVNTSEKKTFYFADQMVEDVTYRIFNYRLAGYQEFMRPGALECRGIMFRMECDTDIAEALVSHPMPKFFNVDENPSTIGLDYSELSQVMDKADGSLMSTFDHGGHLGIKSKGSLHSSQVSWTHDLLMLPENDWFKQELLDLAQDGYTANMEYCAPHNRIVLGYMRPKLIVLNVRSIKDGTYLSREEVSKHYPQVARRWVDEFTVEGLNYEDGNTFVADIANMQGIEGFILQLPSGQFVKKKTEWYLVQHRAKDSINSPRRLFEAALEDATDDLRSLVFDDPVAIKMIEEMEEKVSAIYNPLVEKVETFYENNKHLDRKDYAIKGQAEFKKEFSLVMTRYLERPLGVKEYMRKHYRDYGITDVEPETGE